jgi:hypothetical protein
VVVETLKQSPAWERRDREIDRARKDQGNARDRIACGAQNVVAVQYTQRSSFVNAWLFSKAYHTKV